MFIKKFSLPRLGIFYEKLMKTDVFWNSQKKVTRNYSFQFLGFSKLYKLKTDEQTQKLTFNSLTISSILKFRQQTEGSVAKSTEPSSFFIHVHFTCHHHSFWNEKITFKPNDHVWKGKNSSSLTVSLINVQKAFTPKIQLQNVRPDKKPRFHVLENMPKPRLTKTKSSQKSVSPRASGRINI